MRIIKQDLKIHIYPSRNWYIDWYKNGWLHREDGTATIWNSGKSYYLNNIFYDEEYIYWEEVHENY